MHVLRSLPAVCALALVVFAPSAASAQNPYARVTITNQTDVAVVFDAGWEGQAAKEVVIDPGKAVTVGTEFAPGPTRPKLTVKYRQIKWVPRVTVDLDSGHVDPRTNNPGRVYDFNWRRTNEGTRLMLSPR
ncbi:MAG TPA: hypothetical protein VKD90_21760 [Gemmataceae bacterium]|nr:hypothetical protein [Gemmataceae bacterium]